jgi:hypothetical protein
LTEEPPFLVSDQSSRSLACSRELTYAIAHGKPIVRIEAVRATGAKRLRVRPVAMNGWC